MAVDSKLGRTDLARPTIRSPRHNLDNDGPTRDERYHHYKHGTAFSLAFFFFFLLSRLDTSCFSANDCFGFVLPVRHHEGSRPSILFPVTSIPGRFICEHYHGKTRKQPHGYGQAQSVDLSVLMSFFFWGWAHLFLEPQRFYDEMCL